MSPERWREIEDLYHEARLLEGRERAAFLDRACASDETLRRELESLLAFESRAENFIEMPAFEVAATILKDQTPSPIGQSIGPYQVLSMIGAGGMGEVYLAEDTRLGRKVALKVLPSEFTQDSDRLRRFEQEARAASALNHPNILTIFEIGHDPGAHYIAMEYIQGQTLRHRLAQGPIELPLALDIACQIAGALGAAHHAGIVHRDIKPENIMLRPDGYVKVLDFGIAKLTERHTVSLSTEARTPFAVSTDTGVVLGTTSYMSPEQARGLELDTRSDLFSLGVVLYEMVCGTAPFKGPTTADVLAAILIHEAPPPSSFIAGASDLDRVVRTALIKDREERYQDAQAMLSDLRSLKQRIEWLMHDPVIDPDRSDRRVKTLVRKVGLDGVSKPRKARAAKLPQATARARRPARKAITSLAILPFANISGDPEMDYLSDGITETIINTLSQLPKIRVTARSTVFRYKGQNADPQLVGRELGVQAVLTGRIRQTGDGLMIATELIDVRSDSQLWGEHYNRNRSDIFEVQGEIAKEITENLRLKLTRKEKSRIARQYTADVEAYHAYLKGRFLWNKRTAEAIGRGIEYFKQAIDRDPNFASAFAGLSDSYTLLVVREALSPEEGYSKAKAAAKRALEIDEGLAEAHASLGHAMLHNWEWEEGEKELKKAIELNPGYPSAHHWYSEYLTAMGRCAESIRELKLAAELDPLSLVISADLGRAFYYAREYDDVIEQEARTLELDPSFWLSHINLGRSYIQKGMHAEAVDKLEQAKQLSVGSTEAISFLAFAYAAAGKWEKAVETLSELDRHTTQSQSHGPPYHYAVAYTGLGDKDRAFEWLERAFEKHSVDLFTLNVEPMFDGLRSDPRFENLLQRVGLLPSGSEPRTETQKEARDLSARPTPAGIAILPFKPLNPEHRDEYLELGIADALITRLSDIKQIVVRPTSSVRKYTDLEQDPVSIGKEMAVESVLEGSIQKLADRIRVTARLVRVEDGRSLWAGKFDENFTDIFAVEDSISEKVASALALHLTGDERERLRKRYTDNTAAYNLYLKGRFYWNKRTEESLNKAVDCFNQAIEIDEGYALSYAGLADCYTKLGDVGVTAMTSREAFLRARRAALKALEIDSSIAEVHASLGHLNMHLLRWADAERDLNHAIELNPNYASAHHWYAYFMAFHHRFDDALKRIDTALQLEPLSLPIADSVGEFLYFARRNHEAIEHLRKTLELDPHFLASRIHLGRVYEQLGMFREAEEQFLKARQVTGESIDALAGLGHAYAMSNNRAGALKILAELSELSKKRYVSPYDRALIHAALRETDEAFRWLEHAYDQCAEWIIYTNVDPRLDPLREDARFDELLERLGFRPEIQKL